MIGLFDGMTDVGREDVEEGVQIVGDFELSHGGKW
jgi:hypothetical protein